MTTRAEEIAGEEYPNDSWDRQGVSTEQRNLRIAFSNGYKQGQQKLCARMEAICKRRYRDGDTVYFRTFGMSDEEDGQFLVRINRMFLHKAPTLMAALESAMKEWEESDDPNDQLAPLPSPPNPEQR